MVRALLLPSPILLTSASSAGGAVRALVRPSREEFLKINIRVRGGERAEKGLGGKKKIRYPRSPWLLSFPSFFPRRVYQLFLRFSLSLFFFFFFLRYPPAKRIARRRASAPSFSLFLDVTRQRRERAVERTREAREEQSDRFQGRGLASEEVGGAPSPPPPGGSAEEARESLFSQKRTARTWYSLCRPNKFIQTRSLFPLASLCSSVARTRRTREQLNGLTTFRLTCLPEQ